METDLKALLLVILCVKSITCYSHGRVTSACTGMIPSHGHKSSPDPPPYSITVENTTFSPGDQIKVTLSALSPDSSVYFKGFFIQARNAASPGTGAIGEFTLVNSTISQLLRCNEREASAVSHTSGSHKTKVEAIWKAPQDSPPNVQFIVTVVQKYSLYWVKIPGPVISVNGASPLPSLSTAEAGTTTTSGRLPQHFTSEGCGTTKSCIRDPEGCNPQNGSLCYFLSFRKEDESVMFELSGPASGYVSFALSTDEWMGNDDVYLCVREAEHVTIGAAYVEGRTHPIMASKNVLRDTKWQLADGGIYCSFRRNIQIPSPNDNRFDLDKMYYLFLANGRQDDGRIHRHDRQPLISSKKVALTGPSENLTGSRAPLLIKFHAAFMLVGWMMTVSTGAIIARYFKPDWPKATLCGQKVWFQFHRGLMLLTVLLTCIGFILPFVYRRGWSKRAGSHPYLGCSVMVLAIIQPITALFRPAPDSSRRYIFNWGHLCLGTVTQVLAVVAIFFGIHQQALLLPAPWTTGLLAGCVIWFVLADLTLEVHRRGLFPIGRIFKNIQVHTERRQMDDKEEILVVQSENESYMKGFCLKKIIFAVYLCGNLIFMAVLLGTISGV